MDETKEHLPEDTYLKMCDDLKEVHEKTAELYEVTYRRFFKTWKGVEVEEFKRIMWVSPESGQATTSLSLCTAVYGRGLSH
eukprot:COSAG02_NODE_126_length_34895_cov_10.960886_11_plen_81_part_00